MEVLVAMTVSTIIIGGTASIFVTAMHSWDQGNRAYELARLNQSIGGLIERHLRAAMVPSSSGNVIFDGLDLSNEQGSGHSLSLISTQPGRFPRSAPLSDAAEVEFYFEPGVDAGLFMRVDPMADDFPFSDGYDILLSDKVTSFRIIYFDGYEWVTDWTHPDALPLAVEFYVTIEIPSTDPGRENDWTEVMRLVSLPLGAVTGSEESAESTGEEVRTSASGIGTSGN